MTSLGGRVRKLILVVYGDGTHDLIEPYLLDYLLTTGRISRFCRASGWVTVGEDPVRKESSDYGGKERRSGKRRLRSSRVITGR